MGQKREKMTIKCLKLVQITQILDRICILMVFIEFQNFEIFCPIFLDFWPKNPNFFADTPKILEKKIQREIELVLGKWANWFINW